VADAVGLWDLDVPGLLRRPLGRDEASCHWPCMSLTMRNFDVDGEGVFTYIACKQRKWAWSGIT
jgi:hypothetical protein